MKNIEVKILNPEVIENSERMLVAMARLTQRAQRITNMDDFMQLYNQSYTNDTVSTMCGLPHPTLQKFGRINIAIVGASRRFLAQITRHQDDVKFMSGSLQYSDYSSAAQFVVPYEITTMDMEHPAKQPSGQPYHDYYENAYLRTCQNALYDYEEAIKAGISHDAAGYMMPQGMRNVLVISATPFQWKHMISQRVCNRNTLETKYVMLLCWEALFEYNQELFMDAGPACINKTLGAECPEGKFCCGHAPAFSHPSFILDSDFPYIRTGGCKNADNS